MAFSYTTAQLSALKYFLGYGNLTILARPYFDIAAVFETVVQNNTDAYGGAKAVAIIANLEQLELDIMNCRTRMAADKVGTLERNKTELQDLQKLFDFQVDRLSLTTKVPRVPVESTGGGGNSLTVT